MMIAGTVIPLSMNSSQVSDIFLQNTESTLCEMQLINLYHTPNLINVVVIVVVLPVPDIPLTSTSLNLYTLDVMLVI